MLNFKYLKEKVLFISVIFVLSIIIPFASFVSGGKVPTEIDKTNDNLEETFRLYDKSSNKIIKVSGKELIYGTVACEMLPSFEEEALKAQAVASYTYFMRMKDEKRNNKYDAEVDTLNWRYYVTKDQIKEKFKDLFEPYYNKITKAVDEVYGEYMAYDNKPILAMYHAISSGNTENSEDVFGEKLLYLQNTPSQGDLFAPNYMTMKRVTQGEFKKIIKNKYQNIDFGSDPSQWIKNIERTSNGMVKKLDICKQNLSGGEVRSLFSLRSSNFDISFDNDEIVFHVRGYGHGVGLSQYGAEYMAKQGANYKEILSWYYKNANFLKK